MRPKLRLLRIDLPKQVANSRPVSNVDIQLADSEKIAQLRVKHHSHIHLIMSFRAESRNPKAPAYSKFAVHLDFATWYKLFNDAICAVYPILVMSRKAETSLIG